MHCIYFDYAKAFDKVDHYLLFNKLKDLNVNGIYINIIKDYLFKRHQYVYYNGIKSLPVACPSGVPQGSILGPFLFLIFINDVIKFIKHCNTLLYADDMKIYLDVQNDHHTEITSHIQEDIDSIYKWTLLNNLPLNVDKCCFIVINAASSKNKATLQCDVSYSCNNVIIKKVEDHTDLGITFSQN